VWGLKEVNFKTMESRLCQGLFFAGEILDIDGVTGVLISVLGQLLVSRSGDGEEELGRWGRMKRISLLCVCAVQLFKKDLTMKFSELLKTGEAAACTAQPQQRRRPKLKE